MRRPTALLALALLSTSFAVAAASSQTAPPPPPPPPPPPLGAVRAAEPITIARDGDVSLPMVGSASLSGTIVTDDATGAPVRRARVTLRSLDGRGSRLSVTDDNGRFTVDALPGGRYTLMVNKPGYVPLTYGADDSRSPGVPIAIDDGQPVAGLVARLARGAVITGHVVDSNGRPAAEALIAVLQRKVLGPGATLLPAPGISPLTRTDDRGEFRLYGLPSGDYVVAVSAPLSTARTAAALTTEADVRWATGSRTAAPPRATTVSYATVFYPDTLDPDDAAVISLGPGEVRSGLNLVLRYVPTSTVSGRVTRADGQPVGSVFVIAVTDRRELPGIISLVGLTGRTPVAPDGRFTMRGLQPGTYSLIARASSQPAGRGPALAGGAGGRGGIPSAPAANDLWAQVSLTVNGQDVEGLSLTLQPGMTVSGRIALDRTTREAPTDLSGVSLSLRPPPDSGVTLGVPAVSASADGTFEIAGVAPGSYILTASGLGSSSNPSWTLASAMTDGVDIADVPLEVLPQRDVHDVVVTLTDRITQVSGRLIDADGRPAPELYVLVFSANRRDWWQGSRRLRTPVHPGTDGRFQIVGLPPGDYLLAALPAFDRDEWHTPAFLEQIVPGAIPLHVGEGEQKVQDIQVAVERGGA